MTDRKDVWKMFNRISPTYDRVNRILSLGMDQGWRRKVSSFLPERNNLRLLDLATGTGDQLIALFESPHKIETAVGLDLADEMLALGQKKVEARPYWNKIEWLRADAENIPFADSSFDAITFSFGIRNVSDPAKSLREMYRTLKPEGKALILEFSLPPRPIRPLYFLYLRHILPRVGARYSNNPAAYRYLNETIETFPCGKAFCTMMEEAGFHSVKAHWMAFGAVTLYVGEK